MAKVNKTSRLYVRLSDDELDRLRDLSKDYPSISSFVLDACWHFNGPRHFAKLDYLDQQFTLIKNFRSDLSHLAANFNQLVQYTNNCIKMGIYLPNTADEVVRLQDELVKCMVSYNRVINKLEKDLKSEMRNI